MTESSERNAHTGFDRLRLASLLGDAELDAAAGTEPSEDRRDDYY
jgi:hypothetical protein